MQQFWCMPLKIFTTEDGSQSLFDEELNETYHSTKGARSESEYVFLKMGLDCLGHEPRGESWKLSILEVGFGTGLNACLSWEWAEQNRTPIEMVTLEPFPIGLEIRKQMDLAKDIRFNLIHESEWNKPVKFSDHFNLEKRSLGLENVTDLNQYDVIYFDAFAPSKQPDVWSLDNLRKCFASLKNGGILTTYCAQGQFKRNLKEVGFEVEVLPGALGKKEMVRAKKA